MKANLIKRGEDKWGSGAFGAARGSRTHNGIDYKCDAGAEILAPCDGIVTKLGFAYADDLSFRYVQITEQDDLHHRVFYIEPDVVIDEFVYEGDVIGTSQDLTVRYPGIVQHCHYEIKEDGKYKNPE